MSSIPWCSCDEWERLSTLVCSIAEDPENAANLELTISVLNCILSRLPAPPIGLLMTAELLRGLLAVAGESGKTEVLQERRSEMAFAVVRFVNYVSHAYHDPAGYGVQPLNKVASQQNVPDWVVTLRHDAVHGEMPAGHLLRNAMLTALQWTITAFWRPCPESGGQSPSITERDAVTLQRLERTLAGPRGRHLDSGLLVRCLSSETLRQRALRRLADAMVGAFLQLPPGVGSGHLHLALQPWVSAVTSVCRGDLLTDLLDSLLTCPAPVTSHAAPVTSERCQAAAAVWVEQLVSAARREDAANRLLVNAVGSSGPICYPTLLQTALRHKNSATSRILPLLMDGLSPPLPKHRRQLLLQLVSIATGSAPLPPRPPVTVGPEQLRRLGIPQPGPEPENGPTPATPAGATVVPPTDFGGDGDWRRCADGPEWLAATEVGRLPWQHKTPLLLDASYPPAEGLA